MKYTDPELIEHLAAEYVLGTLTGKARQRFERLQMESLRIRKVVWEWEQRLYPMTEAIEDETPPAHLWHAIRQRTQPELVKKNEMGFKRSLLLWRGWGAFATATILAITVLLFEQQKEIHRFPQESYMAVFNNEEAQPLWVISSDLESGQLSIRAVNAEAEAVDKAFELWMLPGDDTAPRSLGLMPVSGEKEAYTVDTILRKMLKTAKGLAVSVEPLGGSPTGLPTGPVVYQTTLIEL